MANDVKATRGPWMVKREICQDHRDSSADVVGPNGEFIANCGCGTDAEANAALISVAPELQTLVWGFLEFSPQIGGGRLHQGNFENWKKAARDVLAKAEAAKEAKDVQP